MQFSPEMKQALLQKRQDADLEEADMEVEVEEQVALDVDDYHTMVAFLSGAMRMLGFYGDRELSKNLVVSDRKRMLTLAEEINTFLTQLQSDSEEE